MRRAFHCAGMRMLFGLMTAAVVLIPGSTCVAGIHRGPATRDSTWTPSPVVITPSDRVRIQMVTDRDRVPPPLRGKFVGSITDFSASKITVVLEGGQPAVVHRDLIVGLEKSVDHGSAWKHALVGAGIGAAFGALVGVSSSDDWITPGEMAAIGAILHAPIGALIGAFLPSGKDWQSVPLDRVEWSPAPDD